MLCILVEVDIIFSVAHGPRNDYLRIWVLDLICFFFAFIAFISKNIARFHSAYGLFITLYYVTTLLWTIYCKMVRLEKQHSNKGNISIDVCLFIVTSLTSSSVVII